MIQVLIIVVLSGGMVRENVKVVRAPHSHISKSDNTSCKTNGDANYIFRKTLKRYPDTNSLIKQ